MKLNNKGFTLIELVAIVVVLTAIFLVAVPVITKMSKDSETKKYNVFVDLVCDAAKSYVYSNPDDFDLDETGDSEVIMISELIDEGLVSSTMRDPKKDVLASTGSVILEVSNDLSLICSYQSLGYRIVYNLDGGSVSSPNPTYYDIDTPTFTLNNPTKSGYAFAGWHGKNQSTNNWRQGDWDGANVNTNIRVSTDDRIYVASGQQLTLSFNDSSFIWSAALLDTPGATSYYDTISWQGSGSYTFTASRDTYVAVVWAKPSSLSISANEVKNINFQAEYGSVATSYEPYLMPTVTINQGSSGNREYTATWGTPYSTYTMGQLLQYDPVNNTACTSGNTCYNWRVITVGDNESNPTITLQMDHNIVNSAVWVSKADYDDDTNFGTNGNTNKGPITALKTLETATSSWNNSLKLNYTYDTSLGGTNTGSHYGTLSCTNGACTVAGNQITTNLKARMITGEEIAAITVEAGAAEGTNAYNWTLASPKTAEYYFSNSNKVIGTNTAVASGETGSTTLSWLVEKTLAENTSGATSTQSGSTFGYWTLSPCANAPAYAWLIHYGGGINTFSNVAADFSIGIRPVITIPKSIFE